MGISLHQMSSLDQMYKSVMEYAYDFQRYYSIIHSYSWINGIIIGRKFVIWSWVRIDNICVIGDDVIEEDEVYMNGTWVLPHKAITLCIGTWHHHVILILL